MPTPSCSATLPGPQEQIGLVLASQPSDNSPGPIRGVSHRLRPPISIVRWATLDAGNQIGSEWSYVQDHGGLIEGRSKSAHGKGGKQCAIEYLDVVNNPKSKIKNQKSKIFTAKDKSLLLCG